MFDFILHISEIKTFQDTILYRCDKKDKEMRKYTLLRQQVILCISFTIQLSVFSNYHDYNFFFSEEELKRVRETEINISTHFWDLSL